MTPFEAAKNPASRQRPVPFWSWNDCLDPQECCHQIDLMEQQGIGGFFMHARGGLHTEYLSDPWFDTIRACLHRAQELGMNAWAYDENGWPSGFGGGLVNGKGLFYQQKYLRCKEVWGEKEARAVEHPLAIFTEEGAWLPLDQPLPQKQRLLVCFFQVNPYYVDTLDGRVIAQFIQCTHQEYFQRLSPEERRNMRGFFTDEPQISRDGYPWSLALEEAYRERFQEELRPRLIHLFYSWGKDYRRTRYRYWRTCTELFSQNFMKQIHDWCQDHDWELTGHLVLEETLLDQLTSNGACMPHYEYFHIPGMDILCRDHSWVTLPLQLFSAAAQTGKRQILSETFALCGWAVSFADLQWLVQWQFVHGVNLVCQHLEGYSLRGIRKRDYPASLFRHQPWWEYYKPFNDYLSRMGTLLESGDVHYPVLLMHPQSTAMMHYNNSRNGTLIPYQCSFKAATDTLEAHQINHHYGDEILMERHGRVENGALVIGEQAYRLVILPKLNNLSRCQVRLLEQFIQEGGQILGLRNDLEESPFAVDGEGAPQCSLLEKVQWFDTLEALVEAIPQEFRPVRVTGEDGADAPQIHCTARHFPDFDGKPAVLHYFVNNRRFEAVKTLVSVPGVGVEGYSPRTGERYPVPYTTDGKVCLVPHVFSPAGDLLLLSRPYPVGAAAPAAPAGKPLALAPCWQVAKASENLLTLDHCRCEVDGEELFAREYVLTINDALLAREKENQEVALEFTFQIGEGFDFQRPLDLLLEHPERHRILVNGKTLSSQSRGFFADPAFQRISLEGVLQPGENRIRLETTYHQDPQTFACLRASKIFESERNKLSLDSEIEAIYLAGHFGVATPGSFQELTQDSCRYQGDFLLTAQPREVPGDHLEQGGFPFFAGTITLAQEVLLSREDLQENRSLHFENLWGNVLLLKINGHDLAPLTLPEYHREIPREWLQEGVNRVEATLVTSLRNMLGPHHLEEGDSHTVCPWSFYKTAGGPFTAHGAPAWNDGYCFVRHGMA